MDFLKTAGQGIKDLGDDFGGKLKDATGNVTKAYLCVRDTAGKKIDMIDPSNFSKDSAEVQQAILKKAAEKMTRSSIPTKGVDITATAESLLKGNEAGTSSSNRGLSIDELANLMSGKYIPIQVQYNPSTLQYHSDLGGRRRINAVEGVGAGGDGMSIKTIPQNTELSCTLVFEKINVNDAFIQASEGWNASLGNVTSTIGSAVNKIKGGSSEEPYSVRKEVEGFLALLSTTYTRDVIFFYGKICFHGELTVASANYKMFNKRGDPILAEVSIRIRQNNENLYDQNRWRTSFDALFTEGGNANALEEGAAAEEKSALSRGWNQIGNAFSGGIF